MRARLLLGLCVVVLVGCSDPPTCDEAIGNFYDEGCEFTDLNTGDPISEFDSSANCRGALLDTPSDCEDELDDWLSCLADLERGSNSACQSCNGEQETWVRCL